MQRKFETITEYNDRICFVILKAPDRFPVDTEVTLDSVFDELRDNLSILKKKITDDHQIAVLGEMLEISYEAYRSSNLKKAIYTLQEFQAIVWPRYKKEPKYAIEAANRVSKRLT